MGQPSIYKEQHQYIIKRLKSARSESGLDQSKVAQLLNKTQSYVSKVESGQRRIDVVQLSEFARVYRKNLNYFIKE